MVPHKDIVDFIKQIHRCQRAGSAAIKVYPSSGEGASHWPGIDPDVDYNDDITPQPDYFARVDNYPTRHGASSVFSALVCVSRAYELDGRPQGDDDSSRGNHGLDLGYRTYQSTDRDRTLLDGTGYPSLAMFHTCKRSQVFQTHPRAITMLRNTSRYLRSMEPMVYSHPPVPDHLKADENCKTIADLTSRLGGDNIIQAARLIVTRLGPGSGDGYLIPHFDWPNCTHPMNSPVYGINQISWCKKLRCWSRECMVTYSRASLTASLEKYYRMYPLIKMCKDHVATKQPHQIERGQKFISFVAEQARKMSDAERVKGLYVMSPPHLDKMTFYDSIADSIMKCCAANGFTQLHCVGFLVSVLVSQNTDYFRSSLLDQELVSGLWTSTKDNFTPFSDKGRAIKFCYLLYDRVWQMGHLPSIKKNYKKALSAWSAGDRRSPKPKEPALRREHGGICVHQSTNHARMSEELFEKKFKVIHRHWKYFLSEEYWNTNVSRTSRMGIHRSAQSALDELVNEHVSSHLSCTHIIHVGE